MHMNRLMIILSLCCFTFELAAAGAIGKPRFKDEIAFNEVLRLEFSTLLPNAEQHDISGTIVNAMDMSNNRSNWLLAEEPAITVNNKSRYVKIQISLLPRQTGTLRLPEIPLTWLEDQSIPNLGNVDVREQIVIGNHTQALPSEIDSVGGFAWKMSGKDLQKKLNKASKIEGDGQITYTTRDGLELIVRQGQLAEAKIKTSGWYLRQARFNFIDRWGQPRINKLDSETPHLTWSIGWLRIHATELVKDGKPHVTVTFTREDIDSRLLSNSINKQVFKLLESDQTSDELWSKKKESPLGKQSSTTEPKPVKESTNEQVKQNPVETPTPTKRVELPEADKKDDSKEVSPEMLEALFKEAQKNKKQ